jgi:hypothetical protein
VVNRLRTLLEHLEADGASGRVTIKGVLPAVVYLDGGGIYCAERRDQPTLLHAMAEAELFTADEWQYALRLPTPSKWRALVADDDDRLAALTGFARAYVATVLPTLIHHDLGSATFAPRVAHPFGPLRTWSLDELVPATDAGEDGQVEPPCAALAADRYDRREFLELLMEVSPLVRGAES